MASAPAAGQAPPSGAEAGAAAQAIVQVNVRDKDGEIIDTFKVHE